MAVLLCYAATYGTPLDPAPCNGTASLQTASVGALAWRRGYQNELKPSPRFYVCLLVCVCELANLCLRVCVSVCMLVCVYWCMFACVRALVYVCLCVYWCMFACVRALVYTVLVCALKARYYTHQV